MHLTAQGKWQSNEFQKQSLNYFSRFITFFSISLPINRNQRQRWEQKVHDYWHLRTLWRGPVHNGQHSDCCFHFAMLPWWIYETGICIAFTCRQQWSGKNKQIFQCFLSNNAAAGAASAHRLCQFFVSDFSPLAQCTLNLLFNNEIQICCVNTIILLWLFKRTLWSFHIASVLARIVPVIL